jgi:hypothetical protein
LKQGGIHQGEQDEPNQVARIDRQATTGALTPEQKGQTCWDQSQASDKPWASAIEQRSHGSHGGSPEREGQHHQKPESQ